ncbi:hypothetical protein HK102_014156, partial [Quaeritorhiza haematococci]
GSTVHLYKDATTPTPSHTLTLHRARISDSRHTDEDHDGPAVALPNSFVVTVKVLYGSVEREQEHAFFADDRVGYLKAMAAFEFGSGLD